MAPEMPSPYEPEGPQGLGDSTFAGWRLRVKTRWRRTLGIVAPGCLRRRGK
jgi:hypothetical protein